MPRFITQNWIKAHDQSGNAENRYKPGKQTLFKTSMLGSDLCDYIDAYIVVEGDITVEGANNRDKKNRSLAFKNNASYIYHFKNKWCINRKCTRSRHCNVNV